MFQRNSRQKGKGHAVKSIRKHCKRKWETITGLLEGVDMIRFA